MGLAYILPIIIYNVNCKSITRSKYILNWVISGVGICLGGIGAYVSVKEIIY